MRRKYIWATALLLLLILGFTFRPRPVPRTAKFKPVAGGFIVPSYRNLGYEFLQVSPFEGGKMWVRTDRRWFLYDIEAKQVLGELIEDWPIFLNGDQSKLLVHSDDPSLGEVFSKFTDKLSGGKLNLSGLVRAESFRVLDLKTSTSVRLGRLYQSQGSGSTWFASPTSRYGFNWPTVDRSSGNIYICDLQEEQMMKVQLLGDPAGWWDNTRILLKTSDNDLALYDVENKQTSTLLQAGAFEAFLRKNQITNELAQVNPFQRGDRFYLTDRSKRGQGTNSILIQIQKPSGALDLLTNDFKFEWSDHFDSTGRYYLYSGREVGEASSAVFVRDLTEGTIKTLVADDGAKRFSIPRWYKDNVIYVRSNMLWQVSLVNTNPVRLFPPPGQ